MHANYMPMTTKGKGEPKDPTAAERQKRRRDKKKIELEELRSFRDRFYFTTTSGNHVLQSVGAVLQSTPVLATPAIVPYREQFMRSRNDVGVNTDHDGIRGDVHYSGSERIADKEERGSRGEADIICGPPSFDGHEDERAGESSSVLSG
jgi:hypothetical protein